MKINELPLKSLKSAELVAERVNDLFEADAISGREIQEAVKKKEVLELLRHDKGRYHAYQMKTSSFYVL